MKWYTDYRLESPTTRAVEGIERDRYERLVAGAMTCWEQVVTMQDMYEALLLPHLEERWQAVFSYYMDLKLVHTVVRDAH